MRASLFYEKQQLPQVPLAMLSQAVACALQRRATHDRTPHASPLTRVLSRRRPKAYADFETAVAAAPTHPDIFCHRGQLHLLQNEFSQAVSRLRVGRM